jgi:hypothetical protein
MSEANDNLELLENNETRNKDEEIVIKSIIE